MTPDPAQRYLAVPRDLGCSNSAVTESTVAARDDVSGSGIEALQARVDATGLALMNRHPNLRRMGLDEWLAEHHDALMAEERREGIAILEMDSSPGAART